MDLVHIWQDRFPYHIHDLNIKATDFALHPHFQLIQGSYAVWWQLLFWLCFTALEGML